MFNIRKSAASIGGVMDNGKNIDKNPWLSLYKSTGRRLAFLEIGANMAGAGIVTTAIVYFVVEILETIPDALNKFRRSAKIEDDITWVIIKIEN
jgi:hypothetical protein